MARGSMANLWHGLWAVCCMVCCGHAALHVGLWRAHGGATGTQACTRVCGGSAGPCAGLWQAHTGRAKAMAKVAGKAERITHRGCCRRTDDDSDACFYSEGVGVADWLSRYH
eukprot:182989-Prymnesium_polylepis.2